LGLKRREYLNPRERRDRERKKIANELEAARKKASRLRQDLSMVKKVVAEDGCISAEKGRVIDPEYVTTMDKTVRDIVEDNIIFQPNDGPQTDFLAAPETDVLYGGAAGGGKSYAMIIDPLRYAHIKDHRALLLRKTMPELRELIDKTRELYPQAFPGAKYKETEKMWTFPSGAKVEFGFLEKDADVYRYQGQAYSWIGFDEITHLATEFPWNYLSSRLRTTNPDIIPYMRCTANPGGVGHAWVKKRYVDAASWNTSFIGQDGITRKFIPAKLQDNPYLTRDGRYEQMLEGLPELHRRRLLQGDWDVNEGAAFPEFDKNIHVIPPFDIPPSWNRVKGIDYGYASPSACIWAAIDPDDGTIVVYRELYSKGLTAEELGQTIVDMEASEFRSISGVLDTAAWNRTGYSGPTIGEILCRAPYMQKLRPADKNRIAGKIQLHERLKVNENGRPRLQIFENCPNLIRELQSIPYSPTKPEDVDTHVDDHAYDALRYLIMSRPRMTTTQEHLFQFKQDASGYVPVDPEFGY
jgi:hypothetical protein